ncbi:MAG: CHAT domain-containing protein [Microcystis sp. LE19-131.1A]|uniref:CHAT domain-containing protein n=1 Tax=Microcystis sp. LE19-131.1A TaxID=3016439 RepID=UPI0022C4C8FA|nr:CHAT domain-containing tetratricopeptide repeat protein [Microcystis sp. LE19-131.1A]MCZ8241954.1 CHAT domain-containing protein [Microcystis sp. LE19-131.1A]
MNEQRAEAYINLIEQLLTCADDEELNKILQANQELIDPDFLQVMEDYATWLEQQGNNNPAAWLRNMAQQLGHILNPQAGSIEEYQGFLLEVLRAEYESNDPAVVYPILQRCQHLLDDTFAQLLQQFARKCFSKRNIEDVADIVGLIENLRNKLQDAIVIGNLCNQIRDFPLGSRANNLEIAITGYQTLFEVYNREAFPYEWASTQNNLGIAYGDRIRGEKADNLELAIISLNQSLEVRTREAFPYEWATAQNNLGTVYRDRIKGERADNLELAIAAYNLSLEVLTREAFSYEWASTQNNLGIAYGDRIRRERSDNLELAIASLNQSLEVRTREAFPYEWASTQNNLGEAYRNRIRGERANNLELAITAYNLSLEVVTRDSFPYEWAMTQNNLGIAYGDRIRGERANNLELAITAYNLSLEVLTRDSFPYEWARSQNNLGNAYLNRIRGERADNLELAITAYNLSLEVHTHEAFPEHWASTQNNLGNAYLDRIRGERADNLELTFATYNLSLEIYTRESFPYEWATTQNNLGLVYLYRIRGERADNLELAITALNLTLEVRTREAFPEHWASTQNNLGLVYRNRIKEERTDNLELAIAAFNLSLEIRTPTAFPIYCLRTGYNLGITANLIEDWETAIKGYNLAIEAVENTRLEALNPQRQQEILSDAMDVYHGIVQSYLNLNQKDRALEYVERSKTRYLVQLLTDRDIYPKGNIPQTIITELDRLRRAIIGEEQRLAIQEQTRNRGEILTLDQQKKPILNDYTHLNQLKQELNQFIDREITKTKIDEDFILTQTVKPIPFQDILSLTDAETCLLQWYITSEKILAFVVSADGNINLWESSEDNRNKLTDLINNYLQLYYSQNGHQEWINQLSDLLQTFSDTLHINDILALIPNTCKRLIIIPYLFLHILPLHALPINHNQILQDKYDVQYAPSCQLFKITQQRQLNDLNSLFAIQNPQNNLLFTDLEVEIIKSLFVQSDILAKQNATEIAIKTHQNFPLANCIHFSCHGTFNPNKPLESALILTKEKTDQEDGYLRLGEIFELNFKNCRLVMLSACETGLIDLNSISDEYIGLPSGFLFAGSPSVVSSLWKVNDLSTAFLLIKFYETLPKNPKKGEIAFSLKNAQKWLQTLTLDQFEQELERFQLQLDKIINQLGGGKRPIFNESLKQIRQRQPYPFKNPYYWAGFIATGF